MNRVALVGRLTHDPELRRTQSGAAVLNFSVAVNNRKRNGQTGEWEDVPCYVDCVMFGKRAEGIADWIRKGSQVGVDGKLNYNSWEDKQGNKRSKLEVLVDEVDLPPKERQQGGQYGMYDDDVYI